MPIEAVEKAKKTSILNEGEASQLKQMEEAESCPTCGSPMKAVPMDEGEMWPEQGGSHGKMARMTNTDFPGFRQRKLQRGEKIAGGY